MGIDGKFTFGMYSQWIIPLVVLYIWPKLINEITSDALKQSLTNDPKDVLLKELSEKTIEIIPLLNDGKQESPIFMSNQNDNFKNKLLIKMFVVAMISIIVLILSICLKIFFSL